MSRALQVLISPPETLIEGTPEIIEERHNVDLYLAHNGELEVHNGIETIVNYESTDLTLLTIQNRVYPITRKLGDKLFFIRPTHSMSDAYMLPAILVYAVFSTFMNIQLYADPETFVTVPNFVLLIMCLGLGILLGQARSKLTTEILFIKVNYASFESVNWTTQVSKPLVREFFTHRGYSLYHMLAMLGAGVMMSLPFALVPEVTEIDYFIGFVGAFFMVLIAIGYFTDDGQKELLNAGNTKIYGLGVVEAIWENGCSSCNGEKGKQPLGYEGVGVFVPYSSDDKKQREHMEKVIKGKGVLAGVKPVFEATNVLESPDRNYTTLMAEAYRNQDQTQETYEILDSDKARELLDVTAKEYEEFFYPKDKNKINGKDIFLNRTMRDVILFYDRHLKLFRNALSWLGSENRTRTEVQKADKITIRNQQAVISSTRALAEDTKVSTAPIDYNPLVKWGGVIVSILLVFFLFIYMDSNGITIL